MSDDQTKIEHRTAELLHAAQDGVYRSTDRLFVKLMIFQWLFGILIAWTVSPKAWAGSVSGVHFHVWAAIFLGGVILFLPIVLGIWRPGKVYTRHLIAVAQMLYCALLVHLTGGRIETHFQIFGVLAFLAFYRDWRVLITGTVVTTLDHWLRGVYWPESIFGVLTASHFRWMEHAAWVIFEDIILIRTCIRGFFEMKKIAQDKAQLESTYDQLKNAMSELQSTNMQLVQSEKMASIGQLAAGVAHEINNPVGFISNNMEILEQYSADYAKVMRMVEGLKAAIDEGNLDKAKATVTEMKKFEEEINLDFVISDIGTLLQHNHRGLERIRKIVMDLRTFAREDTGVMDLVKVEEVIDSILSIVHNELKYKAELIKNYGDTPQIKCASQKLGQVFINLLINAIHSIKEHGTITVKTYLQGDYVGVEITDTGSGIEEKNLKKIFDPFFTTKPIGQGTGLGLSISYEIIKKHGGEIKVKSEIGQGTTFTILLPVISQGANI